MEVVGAAGAPELEELIRALYTSPGATDVPQAAKVSIAVFDEVDQVAVVEAGEDVTFAVADPTWRVVGGWWPSLGIDSSLGTFPKIVAVVGSDDVASRVRGAFLDGYFCKPETHKLPRTRRQAN